MGLSGSKTISTIFVASGYIALFLLFLEGLWHKFTGDLTAGTALALAAAIGIFAFTITSLLDKRLSRIEDAMTEENESRDAGGNDERAD
jgi:hypothetical protein